MSQTAELFDLPAAVNRAAAGESLAKQRGLSSETLAFMAVVVDDLVSQGEYEKALAGCRFLCTHEDGNAQWWMLFGEVARKAGNHVQSVAAFLTGFATDAQPRFCAELAKTYLAAQELELAAEAVATGLKIVEVDPDHAALAPQLDKLAAEISKRQKQ
ncbi:MAG: hypothetical protein OXC81_07220 [Betaproteobacteria bacterium]|nr:hypothetical protein [Betaproteobacteria bacterium]